MRAAQINDVINALKRLDLSKYPVEEINRLIPYFGKVVIIEYKLHPGKTILRARLEDGQWPYTTRSAHCYKPQQFKIQPISEQAPQIKPCFMEAWFRKSWKKEI